MKIYYILILVLLFPFIGKAQTEKAKVEIHSAGHYIEGKGIEVYSIPTENEVLQNFVQYGYVLKRSTDGKNYQTLATIPPVNTAKFEKMMDQEADTIVRKRLEIAYNYMINLDEVVAPTIDLENESLADLIEKQNGRDMGSLFLYLMIVQEPKVAKALGVSYTDATVVQGQSYFYKAEPRSEIADFELVYVPYKVIAEESANSYLKKITVIPDDKKLSFTWDRDEMLTGFFVERKAYNETAFKSMGDEIKMTSESVTGKENEEFFEDKNLENYKTYTYRFYSQTFWGERVFLGEVAAHPVDKTPPAQPFLSQPKHTKPNEVTVSWKVKKEDADLAGFVVMRSPKIEDGFKALHKGILPKNTRTYTDKTFRTDTLNYYMIKAIDTAKNASYSEGALVVLTDSIPPAKPEFIASKVDKKGVVKLVVKKNKEADLMGYRLFRSNSPKGEFSTIYNGFKRKGALDTIPTVFTDTVTLKTLTPNVYYKVKALDTHYNESDFSEVLKIKRPDTIPPVAPTITKVLVTPKDVTLHFTLSQSTDVVAQMIYRKEKAEANWALLDTLSENQISYVDKNVVQNKSYYYSLRAKDDSGLFSKYATKVLARPYDTGMRPTVTNLKAQRKGKEIVLSWEYREMNENTFFIVYKANASEKLVQYKRTDKLSLTEPYFSTAKYAVKVFTKDGGQSIMSETVGD